MKTILLIGLLVLSACGKTKQKKLYPIQSSAITTFVNQKPIPNDPNLSLDKTLRNTEYPIEIALYQDGRFYYDLPNLGDGHGTWKLKDGKIELKAKRAIFDMYIEVQATNADASALTIQFTDRFGPNSLPMTNVNL